MEVNMMSSMGSATNYYRDTDHYDDVPLPGFRFHPTDEELVGFYLRRKIEGKPLPIQLIKHVDIYKYNPWDLPMNMHLECGNAGDKESYFFCKRGRKYKNSVRPNRVTGSGFWKATGIDRPIYSVGGQEGEGRECIGLKKSLVYYRGKAGKGTKTDWMLHEYRLPDDHDCDRHRISSRRAHVKFADQEAEVWTLCRILKRNVTYKSYIPDWRELSSKRNPDDDESSKTCCSVEINESPENYVSSGAPRNQRNEMQQLVNHVVGDQTNQMISVGQLSSIISQSSTPSSSSSLFGPRPVNEFTKYGGWDELTPAVEFAFNPFLW